MQKRGKILLLAVALELMFSFPARGGDNVTLQGKILFRGKPVPGAVVSVLERTTKAGADGGFRFEGVPALHGIAYRNFEVAKDGALEFRDVAATVPFLVVAAWAEVEEGGILGLFTRKGERAAIRQVTSGDAGRPLTLDLEEIGDREGYCRRCHPTSPALDPKAILRPAKKEAPVPAVTAESYATHRHRDSHPSGFEYGKAAGDASGRMRYAGKVEGIPLGDGKQVDCLTCHTPHLATPASAYAREEFRQTNRLCARCHR